MTTLVSLREQVNDITRDPKNRIRPVAMVDRAINSSYAAVQQELENFIDTTNETQTLSTTAWVQEYTLASDFMILQTVVYWDTALLRTTKKKIVETNQNTTTGSPIYYYIQGGNLWLYPIPNASKTVTIEYTSMLPTITTWQDSEAPSILDSAIVYKTAATLFKQIGKPERELRESEYQSELNLARYTLRKDENLSFRNTDPAYPTITPLTMWYWW